MERYDVIIIGGGPTGATAAHALATAGARVLVLDGAVFPRVKLCAGWITAPVWDTLGIAPGDYPGTLQPFSRATLELEGRVHETRWGHTVSYGIIRREFDHYLLQRAAAAGATVRTNTRVDTLKRDGGSWLFPVGTTQISAPILVGAGGHRCPVARELGKIDKDEAVVMARESETLLDTATLARITATPGIPELILEEDLNGYAWIFTKGNFLNIGLGCIDEGRALNQRCAALLDRLRAQRRLPKDVVLEPFRGHAYAVRLRAPRRPAGDGWLLAGDAAGLARPFSGEGIGPAISSGQIAANKILQQTIHEYPAELEACFGPGQPGRLGTKVGQLPRSFLNRIGRSICHQPQLRRKIVFEGAFGMG
jgi:geranylgeranyl reductase family protein